MQFGEPGKRTVGAVRYVDMRGCTPFLTDGNIQCRGTGVAAQLWSLSPGAFPLRLGTGGNRRFTAVQTKAKKDEHRALGRARGAKTEYPVGDRSATSHHPLATRNV